MPQTPPPRTDPYGYELAYKLACKQLAECSDSEIERQCRRSASVCEHGASDAQATVPFLGRAHIIALPSGAISVKDSPESVPMRDKILILHYFLQAKGTPPSGKLIAYRELPEGANYTSTFMLRAIKPLLTNFGKEMDGLPAAAAKLGGRWSEHGDVSVVIEAFARVPIIFVLWLGDDEFPAEGNILFDSSVPDYLSTEDINVLCESIAWRLVRLKGR